MIRNALPAFFALLLVITVSVPLQAQYALPEAPPQTTRYKLAAGLSYTAVQGKEAALKAKYFVNNSLAMEAQAGVMTVTDYRLYQAYLSFIWQPNPPGMGLLNPYLGIGPAANFLYSYPADPDAAGEIAYYGVIPYGLEYMFANIPVAISFDCKLPFIELNKAHLRKSETYNTIGFGAKFLLR